MGHRLPAPARVAGIASTLPSVPLARLTIHLVRQRKEQNIRLQACFRRGGFKGRERLAAHVSDERTQALHVGCGGHSSLTFGLVNMPRETPNNEHSLVIASLIAILMYSIGALVSH